MDPLAAVLTEPIVVSLATPRSYERGVVYLEEDRVGGLRVGAGRVRASVAGTETYAVELAAKDGGLHASCTCPVGRDGVLQALRRCRFALVAAAQRGRPDARRRARRAGVAAVEHADRPCLRSRSRGRRAGAQAAAARRPPHRRRHATRCAVASTDRPGILDARLSAIPRGVRVCARHRRDDRRDRGAAGGRRAGRGDRACRARAGRR